MYFLNFPTLSIRLYRVQLLPNYRGSFSKNKFQIIFLFIMNTTSKFVYNKKKECFIRETKISH